MTLYFNLRIYINVWLFTYLYMVTFLNIVVGLFMIFGLDCLLLYWGPSVLDKRAETGSIVTHLGLACAHAMPRLSKIWTHAHGRRRCCRKVMVDTYGMTIKAIHFPLDKIGKESLSKIGKYRYKKNVISEICKREERK